VTFIAGLTSSLGACGDSSGPGHKTDAAENLSDGGESPMDDAGDRGDAGGSTQHPDAGRTDGGALGCLGDVKPEACGEDADCTGKNSVCLRGTCVHTCGSHTKEALDESLGEAFEVLGSFCAADYEGARVLVSETDGCEQARAIYLSGGNIGDDTFDWLLWEQVLDPTLASPPLIERMGGMVVRPGSGTTNYLAGFQLSPDAQTAYFAIYDDATTTSDLYRQRVGEAGVEVALADVGWLRSFDWLDEGILLRPDTRLDGVTIRFSLDAVPLENPGARKSVVDPGSSGILSVAVLRNAGIVLVGGGTGTLNQMHVMTLADLRAAYENDDPIVLYSDARATNFDLAPQFRVVGDELLLTQENDMTVGRRIQIDGDSVSFGEAFPVHGYAYTDVVGLGQGRFMFTHFSGTIYARLK